MSGIKIPFDQLSPDTLQNVIEEFVSRSGTDYGAREVAIATKIRQVYYQLEEGIAVLVYDKKSGTCNIVSLNDFALMDIQNYPSCKFVES